MTIQTDNWEPQAFIFHPGRYYVVYPEGFRSKLMPRRAARSYAKIYGGKVHRKPGRFAQAFRRLFFLTRN